ncbi:MAG: ribosome silencing factor [Clostridia bacterium]|nr:ribosome silencing factor [Clostridia bacterium]
MDEAIKLAVKALDSRKAMDIEILHVGDLTVMADYFVICSGSSGTQIRTLGDEVEFQLKEQLDLMPLHREGSAASNWVLLDYGYFIVHVFHRDARDFYKLEHLWADADRVDPESLIDHEGEESNEV